MNITIILGYGIFEESNLQYKSYLDKCLELIKKKKSEKIIFCGGFTNPSFPNISEAKSMSDYCIYSAPEIKDKIILEEKSILTSENIMYAKKIVEANLLKPSEAMIIADSVRIPKVFYFTLATFLELNGEKLSKEDIFELFFKLNKESIIDVTKEVRLTFKHFEFYGIDMARTKEEIGHQISTTILELAAFEDKKLNKQITDLRKQKWGLD